MRFQDPYFLLLLLTLPALVWFYIARRNRQAATIRFSSLSRILQIKQSGSVRLRHLVFGLRLAALVLLILALARPQSGSQVEKVLTEGIDIMIALDVSGSMQAEDFKPDNRLTVAKQVTRDFINGRQNDRIGLVLFAGKAFTQCPLTLDYGVLSTFVDRAEMGLIQDGTAIGNALATAVRRIKNGQGKSKVIILLTDGVNNTGAVNPQTAADLAQTFGIKIYTIGAGKRGSALYPVDDPLFGKRYVRMNTELDEKTLRSIAETTGGQYFRATDTESLKTIFKQIDQMEKTTVDIERHIQYTDLFWYLLGPAALLLLFEVLLAQTRFRRI